ncbi:MAG TPA: hypothetical protein VHT53_13950 [Candidatus Elarobacter sp.]|jgi:hypothetical protein|nr:hypothetical protein [Candidatus Elarobacter sp.]
MQYVEILRARRVLFWYTALLLGLLVIFAISLANGHTEIPRAQIPLNTILLSCAVGGYGIATAVSTGLLCEAATVPITWTRPVPRALIAWRFVAVDLVAIALGYAVMLAFVFACLALVKVLHSVAITPAYPMALALGFATAAMWYALIVLATARLSGHGARVAGLSWLVFIAVGAVWAAPVPAPIHLVLTALNYLDPLSYIDGVTVSSGAARADHPIVLNLISRLLLATLISAGALVAGVRLWSTREA